MPRQDALLIEVIGSLNIDLVTTTPRVPAPGETLTATSFSTGFGGKGANQAVACARAARDRAGTAPYDSLRVRMVGAVGDDQFGRDFLAHLGAEGIEWDSVSVRRGQTTGTAVILVEEATGENRILVTPAANGTVTPADYQPAPAQGIAIFQLETPPEHVFTSIKQAKDAGRTVVLNPAPAIPLPGDIYGYIDHLIVNETEAAILAEISEAEVLDNLDKTALRFLNRGVGTIVITLGAKGVFWKSGHDSVEQPIVPGLKVKVVDTTAAGDTFIGAYAVSLARAAGDIRTAISRANKAASLTVQKAGAQMSIPFATSSDIQSSKGV